MGTSQWKPQSGLAFGAKSPVQLGSPGSGAGPLKPLGRWLQKKYSVVVSKLPSAWVLLLGSENRIVRATVIRPATRMRAVSYTHLTLPTILLV